MTSFLFQVNFCDARDWGKLVVHLLCIGQAFSYASVYLCVSGLREPILYYSRSSHTLIKVQRVFWGTHTQFQLTPVTKYRRSPLPLDIYSHLIKSLTSWPWCSTTGCVPLHTLHMTERARASGWGNWHCHPVPPESLSHSLITAGHCLCCPGNL